MTTSATPVGIMERENGPSKMPPPTALDRILVVWRFACPTNWWASCYSIISRTGKVLFLSKFNFLAFSHVSLVNALSFSSFSNFATAKFHVIRVNIERQNNFNAVTCGTGKP